MEIEASLKGIEELERMLEELGSTKLERKVITKALREGAKIILKEAKSNVPVKSGTLKKSIGIVAQRSRAPGHKIVKVGARAGPRWRGYHGHLVELGVPSRGIPARPFLRDAMRDKFEEFVKKYAEELDEGITTAVKKYVR